MCTYIEVYICKYTYVSISICIPNCLKWKGFVDVQVCVILNLLEFFYSLLTQTQLICNHVLYWFIMLNINDKFLTYEDTSMDILCLLADHTECVA